MFRKSSMVEMTLSRFGQNRAPLLRTSEFLSQSNFPFTLFVLPSHSGGHSRQERCRGAIGGLQEGRLAPLGSSVPEETFNS